jgi:preprotein translocase subunit SecD
MTYVSKTAAIGVIVVSLLALFLYEDSPWLPWLSLLFAVLMLLGGLATRLEIAAGEERAP